MITPESLIPGLEIVLQENRLSLTSLRSEFLAVAVVGSRACGMETPSSDWDLLAIARKSGPRTSYQKPNLSIRYEDPAGDPRWPTRDVAFHASGYAVWVTGSQTWDSNSLDWDGACREQAIHITNYLDILVNRPSDVMKISGQSLERLAKRIVIETKHLHLLKNRQWIPCKELLPTQYDKSPFTGHEQKLVDLGANP